MKTIQREFCKYRLKFLIYFVFCYAMTQLVCQTGRTDVIAQELTSMTRQGSEIKLELCHSLPYEVRLASPYRRFGGLCKLGFLKFRRHLNDLIDI